MDKKAKLELARAIQDTFRIREDSYRADKGRFGGYTLSYDEAAAQAGIDPDLTHLVTAMLVAGYCDFHDWADLIVEKTRNEWEAV